MIIQLPLTSTASQEFTIQLGTSKYGFSVQWNDRSGCWALDLVDSASQSLMVQGLPLVLGQEILEPYNLGAGRLVMVDETGTDTEATFESLGGTTNLYWISADEVSM